jgi:alpha-galactosidase
MKKGGAIFLCLVGLSVSAQDISINKGWIFRTGDNAGWSAPTVADSGWTPIQVGQPWELQGYPDYDGFAWYRLRLIIPSSVKDKAFLKEKLRIDLGKIDDGDEVFLNGNLIGRNGGRGGSIKDGRYDVPRTYILPLNDARIQWDKENCIAVRVWDHGGDGGMYEGPYGISVMDVTDYVVLKFADNPFVFTGDKNLSKKIQLQSLSDRYDFTGKLRVRIVDPITGNAILNQVLGVDFAKDRPFSYSYSVKAPESKTYVASYEFEEGRSKKMITASEVLPYILTPKPGAKIRINGPFVYGARPGKPFLYHIPASGENPKTYAVINLPQGLQIDHKNGIISGILAKSGEYRLKFQVSNPASTASRNFKIVVGDFIGLTPALGWNSWNCWGLSVSDEKVRSSAKIMAEKLADYGWSYINIDDGWEAKRNAAGEIIPNNKFPDMKALGNYVHSLGLKLGIYSSPGPLTCGGNTASYQHEAQDASSYASWGIDYLKYDWCSYGSIAPHQPSLADYKKPYQVMRAALDQVDRDILFSFCQYGMGDVWTWGAGVGGNSWRTTGDITDTWASLSGIGFSQDKCAPYAAPGHFNDPDMLVVGKVGWGPSLHDSRLSPDEQYTHISLWALLSAPLLIGCDMSQLDDFTMNLLTNSEVLAVDQDALGKSAIRAIHDGNLEVWVKDLHDGSKAIGVFNVGDAVEKSSIRWADLHLPAKERIRDLWRQKDLGERTDTVSFSLPSHGVWLIQASSIP